MISLGENRVNATLEEFGDVVNRDNDGNKRLPRRIYGRGFAGYGRVERRGGNG